MAYNPDLLKAAIRYGGPFADVLVAMTMQESGGRLDAVGDNGSSFGPYQMHRGGRLTSAGFTPQQAMNPYLATQAAAKEFAQLYNKGLRGGALAAAAQRPANPGAYAAAVDKLLVQARALLGGKGGAQGAGVSPALAGSSAVPDAGQPDNQQLLQMAMANRRPDQTLTSAVRGAVVASRAQIKPVADGLPQAPPSPQGSTAANNAVTLFAQHALGTPYSWGGGTPNGPSRGFAQGRNTIGYDCSSLVQAAWSRVGVKLPRTTYGQIKAGTAVANLSQARPGDLIFPSTHHVQLYIGNGKVIEAPYTGARVRVSNVGHAPIAIRRPG